MASPAALPPAVFGLRHRLRLARLRPRRRIEIRGRPLLGKGVKLDVDRGARVVLGDDCAIGDGTRIHARAGTVEIGAGAVLGERCALVALAGLEIGRCCLLGDGVVMTDFEPVATDSEAPTRAQGVKAELIRIGDGARVGHGACLGRGARIGPGASIGPHVVVNRDVPPGTVLEGAVP